MEAKFVTVEGGEGVGKSLFVKLLTQQLQAKKIKYTLTREPGGTIIADQLRKIFINPPQEEALSIEAELCIVSAARAQHVKNKIKPALENGHLVICDRFADSSRVYQGMIGGIPTNTLEEIITFTTLGISPGLTFVLDCDTDIALKRLANRMNSDNNNSEKSRFDEAHISFHRRLRQCFLDLKALFPKRVVILDASKEPNEIVSMAMGVLESRFNG